MMKFNFNSQKTQQNSFLKKFDLNTERDIQKRANQKPTNAKPTNAEPSYQEPTNAEPSYQEKNNQEALLKIMHFKKMKKNQ